MGLNGPVYTRTGPTRSPGHVRWKHVLLVVVDLIWVGDAELPELQDHLGALPDRLVVALAAGQEVGVLLPEVWVVQNHRL